MVEAKGTFDEVKGNVSEVAGLWGAIKNWFAGSPASDAGKEKASAVTVQAPKAKTKKQYKEFDESETRRQITQELIKFFNAVEALKDVQAKQQKAIDEDEETDGTLMEQALNMVMINKEIEQMQYDLRQLMVYQTVGLGALYTDTVNMMGVISEKKELARIKKAKAERYAAWQRRRAKDKATDILVGLVGILLVGATIWGMMWVIVQDRMMRWGF